jgi:hypothetical protein
MASAVSKLLLVLVVLSIKPLSMKEESVAAACATAPERYGGGHSVYAGLLLLVVLFYVPAHASQQQNASDLKGKERDC